MSTERVGGQVVFHCDRCPECLETEEGEFRDAFAAAKAQGWVAFKFKGEWMHHCPTCAKES